MVAISNKTSGTRAAPAEMAGAGVGSTDPPQFELVRRLETDRLVEAKRTRTLGIAMFFASMLIAFSAIWSVTVMIPRLSDKDFVIFEVEKSTGVVRIAQELDKPFTPDERVRQYFITQLVRYLETFDRPDVDRMANVLRHFVKEEVLKQYIARMRVLNESVGSGKRLVSVDAILPITTHESAQSYNQSTIDFNVTLQKRDGTMEVQPMVAIMTYRFVPYTKAELESNDEDMRDKIQKNPLGMEVSDYRVDAKLPIPQSSN